MRLLLNWARGSIPVEVNEASSVSVLVKKIAEVLKVDAKRIALYYDVRHTRPLPPEGKISACHITNKSMLFLKVFGNSLETRICQATLPTDGYKTFLGPHEAKTEDKLPSEMKRIRAEFGPRAISTAFFEHRDSFRPTIDRQEESSCYALRLGSEAIKNFQSKAIQTHFANFRLAFLFGRINEVTGKVTVHVACEPPQESGPDKVDLSLYFEFDSAIRLAALFGMKCVGMIISRPLDAKHPMTSGMILQSAHYQNLFGEYFTTLIMMPFGENDATMEAFQVSDVAMRMDQESYFVSNAWGACEVALKEELMVCGRKSRTADTNLFLCAVRLRRTMSKFVGHSFPAPAHKPGVLDLRIHLRDSEFCPNWYRLFDFNLLLFLETSGILTRSEVEYVVALVIGKADVPEELMGKLEAAVKDVGSDQRQN
jgi:hypothetical protein